MQAGDISASVIAGPFDIKLPFHGRYFV